MPEEEASLGKAADLKEEGKNRSHLLKMGEVMVHQETHLTEVEGRK